MKKILFLLLAMIFLGQLSYAKCKTKKHKKQTSYTLTLYTNKGKICFKLLNETPKHRDNLLKLAKKGFYDSVDFHRVVKDFVLQVGDPLARWDYDHFNIGNSSVGYTIEAELSDSLYHYCGAVGMAREDDDINPNMDSSGSHFYIIAGKKNLTDSDLDKAEKRTNRKIAPEIRAEYLKRGGSPHLDGTYTIIGYVVEGMEVVDVISEVQTNEVSVPMQAVTIEKIEINKHR